MIRKPMISNRLSTQQGKNFLPNFKKILNYNCY
jgi:hypothetical protein